MVFSASILCFECSCWFVDLIAPGLSFSAARMAMFCTRCIFLWLDKDVMHIGIGGYSRMGLIRVLYSFTLVFVCSNLNRLSFLNWLLTLPIR